MRVGEARRDLVGLGAKPVKTVAVRWQRERVRLTEAEWLTSREDRSISHSRGGHRPIQEVYMFIAILDFSTAASDRPAALAQLDGEHDQVRAMPGNLAFRVYASRENETRISVVHEWDDEVSFAGYQQSDSFARSGEVLRPLMTGAPVSRRFRAELLETVN